MNNPSKVEAHIRPMQHSDIIAVLYIYNRILETTTTGNKPKASDNREGITYKEIASTGPGSPSDLSLVAEIEGRVSGFIWSSREYVGIPVEEVAVIHMLIVDPQYQRHGIAKKLIDQLSALCRKKGIHKIRAVLEERNWELKNFFEGQDFQNSGLTLFSKDLDSD